MEGIKKIYINSDGGAWIKEGMNQLGSIEYVLDEFHLSKYVLKMTSHMLDSKEDARVGVCKIIRDGTKKEFDEIVERLEGCAKTESQLKRIQEAAKYIKNNWTAAKRRLWRRNGVCACSAEGHVSSCIVIANEYTCSGFGADWVHQKWQDSESGIITRTVCWNL